MVPPKITTSGRYATELPGTGPTKQCGKLSSSLIIRSIEQTAHRLEAGWYRLCLLFECSSDPKKREAVARSTQQLSAVAGNKDGLGKRKKRMAPQPPIQQPVAWEALQDRMAALQLSTGTGSAAAFGKHKKRRAPQPPIQQPVEWGEKRDRIAAMLREMSPGQRDELADKLSKALQERQKQQNNG